MLREVIAVLVKLYEKFLAEFGRWASDRVSRWIQGELLVVFAKNLPKIINERLWSSWLNNFRLQLSRFSGASTGIGVIEIMVAPKRIWNTSYGWSIGCYSQRSAANDIGAWYASGRSIRYGVARPIPPQAGLGVFSVSSSWPRDTISAGFRRDPTRRAPIGRHWCFLAIAYEQLVLYGWTAS